MKKIIISVGVLSFGIAFGMPHYDNLDESNVNPNRSSLIMPQISNGFSNVKIKEIQESIKETFSSVTNKNSDSKTRAKDICLLIQRELDLERVNAGFHNQMTHKVRELEREYQRLIEEKDKEIKKLQEKLDEVLRREAIPSDLETLEKKRKEAEARINSLKNNRQEVIVKNPLTLEDVQSTVNDIDKKIEKFMSRVQKGRMVLNDAIEDTQEYLSEQINRLGKQFNEFRVSVETELRKSHEKEIEALREAYDIQTEIMQNMLHDSENLRKKAEKKAEMLKIWDQKCKHLNSLPITYYYKQQLENVDSHFIEEVKNIIVDCVNRTGNGSTMIDFYKYGIEASITNRINDCINGLKTGDPSYIFNSNRECADLYDVFEVFIHHAVMVQMGLNVDKQSEDNVLKRLWDVLIDEELCITMDSEAAVDAFTDFVRAEEKRFFEELKSDNLKKEERRFFKEMNMENNNISSTESGTD